MVAAPESPTFWSCTRPARTFAAGALTALLHLPGAAAAQECLGGQPWWVLHETLGYRTTAWPDAALRDAIDDYITIHFRHDDFTTAADAGCCFSWDMDGWESQTGQLGANCRRPGLLGQDSIRTCMYRARDNLPHGLTREPMVFVEEMGPCGSVGKPAVCVNTVARIAMIAKDHPHWAPDDVQKIAQMMLWWARWRTGGNAIPFGVTDPTVVGSSAWDGIVKPESCAWWRGRGVMVLPNTCPCIPDCISAGPSSGSASANNDDACAPNIFFEDGNACCDGLCACEQAPPCDGQGDDVDLDEICGDVDNCPLIANGNQVDDDGDGKGNACDNCPQIPNGGQVDFDRDGWGDQCDNCRHDFNPGNFDGDADGVGDACDNCPETFNPVQVDSVGNGVGDACRVDTDGDQIEDDFDNCPTVWNAAQLDRDGDGLGDACDGDDDGDGVPDVDDNCPRDANPGQEDCDGDGLGDACSSDCSDLDTDEDGLLDTFENSVTHTRPDRWDTDRDDLSDGFEWLVARTDPLTRDTDGDRLDDGEEVLETRTNPLLADTDGDGDDDRVDPNPLDPRVSLPPLLGDQTCGNVWGSAARITGSDIRRMRSCVAGSRTGAVCRPERCPVRAGSDAGCDALDIAITARYIAGRGPGIDWTACPASQGE